MKDCIAVAIGENLCFHVDMQKYVIYKFQEQLNDNNLYTGAQTMG